MENQGMDGEVHSSAQVDWLDLRLSKLVSRLTPRMRCAGFLCTLSAWKYT